MAGTAKNALEKKLIKRLRKRDPRAFEALLCQYQGMVFNLLYRMIGSKEEAEDLAQEVFVNVFKKIAQFRGDASLSTWIYRIASNTCINRKKYLRRRIFDRPSRVERNEYSSEQMGPVSMSSRVSRPDELAEGYEMEGLLQTAIAALPEDQRLILILRDIQGVAYDEIGVITGLPLGTVKSRLHRARLSLKKAMAPHLR